MTESTDIVLVKVDQARVLLSEARTATDAKQIMDMAKAAEVYGRRQKASEEAIGYAHEISIEAQRLFGEFLKRSEKNHGAATCKNNNAVERVDRVPTFTELGISKDEAAKAQLLATVAETKPQLFQSVKLGKKTFADVKREIRREEHAESEASAAAELSAKGASELSTVCDIRHCSCAELLAEVKPDAIITDPPYPREFLPVFSELALAVDVPLVAVMVGQSYLPEVLSLLSPLKYRWTLAYMTPGAALRQWPRNIDCTWKPVLLFGASDKYVFDVFKSDADDKRFHEWGQSESGTRDLVERLTEPGQLVCDPFLGGGATAVACLAASRRFVGCDVDAEAVKKSKQRTEAFYARR